MGKFKRNYKDVDRSNEQQTYSGETPKPGIYDFQLSSVKEHTGGEASGNKSEWIFECTQEPYVGWPGWVYTNDESTAWKEVQVLEALGLMGPDDTDLDLTHEQIMKKGGPVRCKLINETYDEEKRAKIKTVLPPRDGQEKVAKAGGKAKKGKKKKDGEESPF